jgi:RNA polymerase sigma-70 factor (ECF subfamily)
LSRPNQPVTAGATELAALLVRVADGDAAAFQAFYDRTSAKLFGVILRILIERQESEDVLQEVYLIVWRKAATFDASKASPITWAATIARNRAIDRLRARPPRAHVPMESAFDPVDDGPAQDAGLIHDQDARRTRLRWQRWNRAMPPPSAPAILMVSPMMSWQRVNRCRWAR